MCIAWRVFKVRESCPVTFKICPTVRGGIDPGGVSFFPRVVGVVHVWKDLVFFPGLLELYMYGRISCPGMGPYHPRVRRDIGNEPHSNLKSAIGVGVFTPCGRYRSGGCPFSSPGCWS